MSLLEYSQVTFSAGGRQILSGVTLGVPEGHTTALLGRSGSGKTTLLRLANRLIEPTSGDVRFRSEPVRKLDAIRLRRSIGYVIQEFGLFPHMTVAQNVGLGPQLEGWKPEAIRARVNELLEMMGLTPGVYSLRRPRELSGGEKQRVGIARALATDPPLLLLDEPFGALDPVTRYEMQMHFLHLRNTLGKTAVFVTHDIREALLVASQIAVLRDGVIEWSGPAQELLSAQTPEAMAFVRTLGRERAHDTEPTRR
jgi:osmoprotectant transport system ATP-binding protein